MVDVFQSAFVGSFKTDMSRWRRFYRKNFANRATASSVIAAFANRILRVRAPVQSYAMGNFLRIFLNHRRRCFPEACRVLRMVDCVSGIARAAAHV